MGWEGRRERNGGGREDDGGRGRHLDLKRGERGVEREGGEWSGGMVDCTRCIGDGSGEEGVSEGGGGLMHLQSLQMHQF